MLRTYPVQYNCALKVKPKLCHYPDFPSKHYSFLLLENPRNWQACLHQFHLRKGGFTGWHPEWQHNSIFEALITDCAFYCLVIRNIFTKITKSML